MKIYTVVIIEDREKSHCSQEEDYGVKKVMLYL